MEWKSKDCRNTIFLYDLKFFPLEKERAIDKEEIAFFQDQLLNWYKENGRSFPWRNKSATNYEIIIAEVFLQRTKASAVANFLPSFFKKYYSWEQLGEATEAELKEFIRPLGLYNQRGSRLFKMAQELGKRNGIFPKERNLVEEIPMMGQYITNAYELYVLKKKVPLLDVNMARILERFFGKRVLKDIRYDKYLQNLAHKVVEITKTKELNWAILDYAASICISNKPKCSLCQINTRCKYNIGQSSI